MMNIVKSTLVAALAVSAFAPSAQAEGSWTDKLTLGADVRYRIQDEKKTPNGADEQANTKQRFRMRFASTGKINDQWTAGMRLVTGNATGRDQDMGGFHSPKLFSLDHAYMKYAANENTTALFGKFSTKFWAAGGNQVVWNQAISSEGVEINHSYTMGEVAKPSLNIAYHTLHDTAFTASAGPDVTMLGAQYLMPFKTEKANFTFAIASYNYSNVKGLPDSAVSVTAGNILTADGCRAGATSCFANDFKLLNAGLEVGLESAHGPVSLYVDYTLNGEAETEEGNVAMIGGVNLGKASAPGSWQVGAHYRDVGRDSVMASLTDSGFLTSATGLYGTGVDVAYGLAENVILSANYQTGAYVGYDKYQRMQIQLDGKF